ncbi:hypothetical protein Ahy_A02g008894 [Arachis hypogaea]|uniref:Uncharacterized protein n=1 Tax=Arachis hypogaea TaxID=3818 RepID=A0A445EFF8_ARAHY|nr:hypothetical protein Ahy_A02g008894 [Arachis hypogaea]
MMTEGGDGGRVCGGGRCCCCDSGWGREEEEEDGGWGKKGCATAQCATRARDRIALGLMDIDILPWRWWNYTGRKFLEGRGETSEGGLEFFLLLKNDIKCIIHGDLSWKAIGGSKMWVENKVHRMVVVERYNHDKNHHVHRNDMHYRKDYYHSNLKGKVAMVIAHMDMAPFLRIRLSHNVSHHSSFHRLQTFLSTAKALYSLALRRSGVAQLIRRRRRNKFDSYWCLTSITGDASNKIQSLVYCVIGSPLTGALSNSNAAIQMRHFLGCGEDEKDCVFNWNLIRLIENTLCICELIRFLIIRYSLEQLFDIVVIDVYHGFVPWCQSIIRIIS